MKKLLQKKHVLTSCLMLLLLSTVLTGCLKNLLSPPQADQIWLLYSDAGVARVVVKPFTNSGTFTEAETTSTGGWWIDAPGCASRGKMNVGGTIVHTSGGDRWSFVGLTGSGCGYMFQGGGGGTANDKYPNATQVNGTVSGTFTGPLGTTNSSGTWRAVRQ